MIYRPRPEMRMWDTWMFKEGENYHLFTLTSPCELGYWDRVCHAVSTDLLHWEDWDDIVLEEKENKDAWDAGVMLTGSTFKCEQGYGMTYGAVRRGEGVQRIGIAFSKDLRTWEKCPSNPVLVAAGPHYAADPATTIGGVAWRDAYVTPVEGGYEATITAEDPAKARSVNGCIARAFSKDLVAWELLPPMASPECYVDMEVSQHFEVNGRHYLLFSTGAGDLPSRLDTRGTFYLMADEKYGDYRVPEDNMLIGAGEGRFDCYVGKVIESDEGLMLYHHICGKRTAFAAPRAVRQDGDGRLWVERWSGLDGLLADEVLSAASPGAVACANNNIRVGEWRVGEGRLHGDAGPAISGWLFDREVGDCAIKARLDLSAAARGGVLFRVAHVEKERPRVLGLALCVNRERGVIQLCEAELQSRRPVQIKTLDNVYGRPSEKVDVEIWTRAEYVEIYVDGRALFSLNADEYALAGKAGFFVDRGKVAARDVAIREISGKLS